MKTITTVLAFGFLLALLIKQEGKINTLSKMTSDLSIAVEEQALLNKIGKEMIYSKLNIREIGY